MQYWKRLTALALSAVLCGTLMTGCAQEEQAAGFCLDVSAGQAVVTLDPIFAQEVGDQTILTHLYENLMRKEPDGAGGSSVVNGMAEEVEHEESHDGTVTFTFELRRARWSDGEDVKASDFVYAWRRLADPASQSPYAELMSIVCGYEEARASGDMSLLQITAKSEDTLEVVLKGHYDWFLTEVCTSPATMPLRQDVVQELKMAGTPEREGQAVTPWWADPTKLVTNGPFQAANYQKDKMLALSSNEAYYNSKRTGPDEINFHFAKTAEAAWSLYVEEAVDAVWPLPESQLAELAADETWVPEPGLSVTTVLFNCEMGWFADAALREAMCMVIDRNALAELAGLTARAAEGLVPPGVPENEEGDFRTAGGALLENDPELYAEQCARARELLETAGYSSGAELGGLEYLYLDEGVNGAVAAALCQQWQEQLKLQITPRGVTKQELWTALRDGTYTVAGVKLSEDCNDAECFLMEWASDGPNNVVRYENSAYDALIAIIASAPDGAARFGCLHDAEDLLLADYALAPLYTEGTAWLLGSTLAGAFRDVRGWFGFANVVQIPA